MLSGTERGGGVGDREWREGLMRQRRQVFRKVIRIFQAVAWLLELLGAHWPISGDVIDLEHLDELQVDCLHAQPILAKVGKLVEKKSNSHSATLLRVSRILDE